MILTKKHLSKPPKSPKGPQPRAKSCPWTWFRSIFVSFLIDCWSRLPDRRHWPLGFYNMSCRTNFSRQSWLTRSRQLEMWFSTKTRIQILQKNQLPKKQHKPKNNLGKLQSYLGRLQKDCFFSFLIFSFWQLNFDPKSDIPRRPRDILGLV